MCLCFLSYAGYKDIYNFRLILLYSHKTSLRMLEKRSKNVPQVVNRELIINWDVIKQ